MLWKSGLIITGLLASIACGFPARDQVPQASDRAFASFEELDVGVPEVIADFVRDDSITDFKPDDSNVSPIREKRSPWTDDGVSDSCPKVYDFVEDPVLEAEFMKCYRRVQEKLARRENELRNGRYSTTETPDDATTIGVEVTSLK